MESESCAAPEPKVAETLSDSECAAVRCPSCELASGENRTSSMAHRDLSFGWAQRCPLARIGIVQGMDGIQGQSAWLRRAVQGVELVKGKLESKPITDQTPCGVVGYHVRL